MFFSPLNLLIKLNSANGVYMLTRSYIDQYHVVGVDIVRAVNDEKTNRKGTIN